MAVVSATRAVNCTAQTLALVAEATALANGLAGINIVEAVVVTVDSGHCAK